MSRSHRITSKFAFTLLLGAAALPGCSSYSTDTGYPAPVPSFGLTVGATTLQLAAGAASSTSLKATRSGGLGSTIAYVVTGGPAGLTTTIAPTAVADSSILTITTTAAVAPGAYTLLIAGTASGAQAQQASINLTVTAIPTVTAPEIRSVAVGQHTCAVTVPGKIYCWGSNNQGQLGNNLLSNKSTTPVAVAGNFVFRSVAVSKTSAFTCALVNTGKAYCWGDNTGGYLGDGTTTGRAIPTAVSGNLALRSITVGAAHACGLDFAQNVWCWGTSFLGALGERSTGTQQTPVITAPGISFVSIAAGFDYTCGLDINGHAFCWGKGFQGQLGNGDNESSVTPVAVSGGIVFKSLFAGGETVCGLTFSSKAYCWGGNTFGTTGDGTNGSQAGNTRRMTPVAVTGNLAFQTLGAGYETMCGVADAGKGYCWGYNVGALGDGTLEHRSTPTLVAGNLEFESISSGTGLTCGVTTDRALYCWGSNFNGALGDGTETPRVIPTPVQWR